LPFRIGNHKKAHAKATEASALPVEDFVIRVYCEECAAYAAVVKAPLRRRGFSSAVSDQEELMLECVRAFLGYGNDQAMWKTSSDTGACMVS